MELACTVAVSAFEKERLIAQHVMALLPKDGVSQSACPRVTMQCNAVHRQKSWILDSGICSESCRRSRSRSQSGSNAQTCVLDTLLRACVVINVVTVQSSCSSSSVRN